MAKTKRKSELVTVDIGRIKPYKNNPKKHTQASIERLADQIKALGYINKIIVDEKKEILVGHRRLLALHFLKYDDVEIQVESGLTPAQKRAYRIADNVLSDATDWDEDLLMAELEDLTQVIDFDMNLTGFDAGEIIDILDPPDKQNKTKAVKKTVATTITCPNCAHVWDEAKLKESNG